MGVKVLAVDDDPTIQHLLRINLEMEGYEVVVAGDGEEAVERALTAAPDVILLDIMMPKLDGWGVCRRLRREADLGEVPIVFLSARAQDADIEKGSELGATAYITKPFDPIDLLELIEDLVQEP